MLWPTESSTANFVFLATRLLTLLSSIADFVLNLDWAGWSPTNQIMDESHSEKPRLGGFALGSSKERSTFNYNPNNSPTSIIMHSGQPRIFC